MYRSSPPAVFTDGGSSITSAPFNVVAGDTLVAVVAFSTATSFNSLTTNDNTTAFTQAGATVQNGTSRCAQGFSLNVLGNPIKTVTYVPSSSNVCTMCVAAYSDIQPSTATDIVSPNGTGTGTLAASGATALRAQAPETMVGGFSHDSASSVTITPGTNLAWEKRAAQESASHAVCVMEDVTVSFQGTEDVEFGSGATSLAWMANISTYKYQLRREWHGQS